MLVAFGAWMIVGLFLDGWAHSEQRPDSFFTPWHGVLYSGFAGAAATALWQLRRRRRPGRPWAEAVPAGYGLSLAGLVAFAAGAAGDLAWHELFGIEVSTAALVSPTHLLLMVGGVLALTGPLRRAWRSPSAPARLPAFLPALVSLTLATGVAVFFTAYASPFGRTPPAGFPSTDTDIHDFGRATGAAFAQLRDMWGLTAILFTTVLLLVPVLLVARRWWPPAGSFTVYFAVVAVLEVAMGEFRRWPLALAGVAAAAVAEAAAARRVHLTVFAAVVAAAWWGAYFAAFQLAWGIGWSAELWSGSIVLAVAVAAVVALVCRPRTGAVQSPWSPAPGMQ